MLVNLNGVAFKYKEDVILSGVDLTVNPKERIGLVGINGAGKTTLLGLICGELNPTSGEVSRKNDLKIGYLKQNSGLNSQNAIYEEMLSVFSEETSAIDSQEKLSSEIAKTEEGTLEFKKLSHEYEALSRFISARDGYNIETKIKTVLNGMGFAEKINQNIATLSGGEKTRLAISKLLLLEPELLILDEPTNHLDFAALAFLESYLSSYKGALIVVSHDRYFLDKVATTIWEVENGGCYSYSGNYSKYKTVKNELVLARTREYQKQQEKIAAMKDYIARNIVRATTAKSAQSRVKQLENLDIIEKPRTFVRPPHFFFNFDYESGKTVLTVEKLSLSAGGKELLKDVDFVVEKGDRVGILGPNGTGKSTLIRALQARGNPSIRYGVNVKIGYYDQENLNMNPNNTVLDELWGRHHLASQTKIRSLLGGLQLGADDIEKPVGVLSGGERAKLGFAVAMAEEGNTLLLDEPTNHLDLLSREALEDALRAFGGTIVFVSHDRYFLNAVATRIFELDNKKITSYAGNFSRYEDAKRVTNSTVTEEKKPEKVKNTTYRTAKDRSAEVKKKQRVAALEKEIEELEAEAERLNEESLRPDIVSNYALYGEYEAKIAANKVKISAAYEEWLSLQDE